MNDLEHVKAMIIVFAMRDCPACEDYKPRFEHQVERFMAAGQPFVWYTGRMVPPGQVPVLMLDATTKDATVNNLMDQYQVEGVPATLLLTRNARPQKRDGALDDGEIYELLQSAALANR